MENTRGGQRPGAGRPNKPATKVIRVPESAIPAINELLALAIMHETTTSMKEKHIAKLKAGKVRKQMKELNTPTDIKIDN